MAEQNSMTGEVFYPSPEVAANAHIRDYHKVNEAAVADLPGFWGKIAAENFEWFAPWERVLASE